MGSVVPAQKEIYDTLVTINAFMYTLLEINIAWPLKNEILVYGTILCNRKRESISIIRDVQNETLNCINN